MMFLLSVFLLTDPVFAIELKSNKPPTNLATKTADIFNCDFGARLENKKLIKLKTEVFKAADLSMVHEDGNKGVYVNVFDFLGYNFYLDSKKQLHIQIEKEEVVKKELKSFTRLPASLITKAEFSTNHNKKTINLKEVTLVCKP